MINTEVGFFINFAKSSLSNPERFSRFVDYAEYFCDLNGLFLSQEEKQEYRECWFKLEVVNALMLADYESCKSCNEIISIWAEEYKRDASEYSDILLNIVNNSKNVKDDEVQLMVRS